MEHEWREGFFLQFGGDRTQMGRSFCRTNASGDAAVIRDAYEQLSAQGDAAASRSHSAGDDVLRFLYIK